VKIIGIDPGREGGLAELVGGDGTLRCTRTLRMPWDPTGARADGMDLTAVRDFVADGGPPDLVAIEAQQIMGGMNAFSGGDMSGLVVGYGELRGMCKLEGWRLAAVYPQAWQNAVAARKTLGLAPMPKAANPKKPTADEKKAARDARTARRAVYQGAWAAWARLLYPEADLTPGKCVKPHDGIVAALAIAHHGAVRTLGLVVGRRTA
jgi:hypothetical protein